MKNCNFISAGAATAKTYVECEKNEANLFHRRARAHPNGAHALTYSSQKADTRTQKAQTEAIIPQAAAQNEACKENNAALKRAIVCRPANEFFSSQ
jgi:hypothetical protein